MQAALSVMKLLSLELIQNRNFSVLKTPTLLETVVPVVLLFQKSIARKVMNVLNVLIKMIIKVIMVMMTTVMIMLMAIIDSLALQAYIPKTLLKSKKAWVKIHPIKVFKMPKTLHSLRRAQNCINHLPQKSFRNQTALIKTWTRTQVASSNSFLRQIAEETSQISSQQIFHQEAF